MMRTLPAVTHEMEFVAKYVDDVLDVMDGKADADPYTVSLSTTVYNRADDEICELLRLLGDELRGANSTSLHLGEWTWPRAEWEIWGEIHRSTRRRQGSGPAYVGISFGAGKEGFRLIGFSKVRRSSLSAQKEYRDAL